MSTAAIIDLGSNTINLLIVKDYAGEFRTIFKTKIPAKLGAGGFGKKTITPEAFKRGVVAMQALKMTILEYRAERIYAFATSAVRDAENNSAFVEEIKAKTGIEINVISGEKEAQLIYNGVSRALEIGEAPELIMDIGGGSTEFIIANNKGVLWKHSFDLGVSRLLEHLKPKDPLSETDIDNLKTFLDDQLGKLFEAEEQYSIDGLIGSSGSFDSLAEMIESESNEESRLSNVTEYTFNPSDLAKLNTKLIDSSFEEREQLIGLVPYRLETIPLASMFINYIITKLSINKIRLSTYALREGVVSEFSGEN